MKIQQLRNATIILQFGKYRVLVDPMLAPKHALPPLKFSGGMLRNPTVGLPPQADLALLGVTHCLITHCQKGHFDHLDRAGKAWLREHQIPVICTVHDAPHLSAKGLNVQALPADTDRKKAPFLGGLISTVPCVHGRGFVGSFMEHGVGYYIQIPGEPSVYLSGDTIFTPRIQEFLWTRKPDISVVPAGGAQFDIGGEIIMGVSDVLEFTRATSGLVIANHLEAISHCPVTREQLLIAAQHAELGNRLIIPQDGETVCVNFPA
ncbi:MAG: MBL fold metallo-hydrolase [Burkholderiales bacterium]|jgi:L-ascorbate metabolism protein UlaG (beta-lactamase superfamily)|uniref:MBL fold metallo-hydrolase n=1 Tax=Limnobacter sp. TaxID=2003368 RepID=UPI003920C21A|nr:MBL fold metallo-hydrolase [Burkholderiales bacterium]